MSQDKLQGIAVFDFDGTLVKGDSLLPFLAAVCGWPRTAFVFSAAVLRAYTLFREKGARRTEIKAYVLRKLLRGRNLSSLAGPMEKMRTWPRWIAPSLAALKEHHAQGRHILIASGGLDLYLPTLLQDTPHDGILCTRMEVVDGILTGEMKSGNCVRAQKAEMLAAYLKEKGSFGESWGYGNAPHDLPMLEHLQHRTIV